VVWSGYNIDIYSGYPVRSGYWKRLF